MKNPLDHLVGFHLVRTGNLSLKVLNKDYSELKLRHPDAAVAMVIEANPGITQSAIGQMLKIERSNIVPIISRLEERGWIERRPGNGKTISLFLTGKGTAIMPRLHQGSQAAEEYLAANLGPEKFALLKSLLLQIG